jgi:hypothetical protein
MKKISVCLSVMSLFVVSCSKTNEEVESKSHPSTTGVTPCDTVNMKYAANIEPILQVHCYSCHGNGNINGGVSLDTYNKVQQQASNGLLYNVISHASGYPAMPYQLPKLPDCDINKIKDWIDRGYQNN